MMATINPLGERARGNRWWQTAAALTVGCLLGGWALGSAAGALGRLAALPVTSVRDAAGFAAAVAAGAGMWELAAWRVPTRRRQVDDTWLVRYRGWVYGLGFGVQLGAGLMTTVTTAAVYATVGLAFLLGLTGDLAGAQLVGAAFGISRATPVLGGSRLHDPERLRRRMSRVAAAADASRLATGSSLLLLGVWMAVSV